MKQYIEQIQQRLKEAGEWIYARGRPDHPPFKHADQAARRLLGLLPDTQALLVMRDQSLRAVRQAVLQSGIRLVVPNKPGDRAYRIPCDALERPYNKRQPVLRIDPLPRGATPYTGAVQAVVVACLAFDPAEPRLYGFDTDRTAQTLESLTDSIVLGDVPVVAIAADSQQVANWPESARSFVRAWAVVTPTRLVPLGLTARDLDVGVI